MAVMPQRKFKDGKSAIESSEPGDETTDVNGDKQDQAADGDDPHTDALDLEVDEVLEETGS